MRRGRDDCIIVVLLCGGGTSARVGRF